MNAIIPAVGMFLMAMALLGYQGRQIDDQKLQIDDLTRRISLTQGVVWNMYMQNQSAYHDILFKDFDFRDYQKAGGKI